MASSEWNFSLQNYDSVWKVMIQLGLLLTFLVIGNAFKRRLKFLKNTYIPSSLVGGIILGIIGLICNKVIGYQLIDHQVMQSITYHSLAIGFIAMTLKVDNKPKDKNNIKLAFQNGLITGSTYMLQAVAGILTVLIFLFAGKAIFYDTGILLPLGFGQGPGNALTWDVNFSSADFMNGIGAEGILDTNGSLGLAIASIGFIVASTVGVTYINIFKRKGELTINKVEIQRDITDFVENNEIEDNDSVDKFSIQLGIVAICYAITFGVMCLLSLNSFTNSIAWGFNFIFGVIAATIVRNVFVGLKKKKIIKHKYINNYQMDRISGFAFDLMIIAGVAAIDINELENYTWVILALCVVGTLVTYVYIRLMSKHCFKGFEHQMFLVNFGTLTGTASNGMILLKEIDTTYQTPAASVFVMSQLPAMITVAPLLLLLNFSATSLTNTIISVCIFAFLAILYTVIALLLNKRKVTAIK